MIRVIVQKGKYRRTIYTLPNWTEAMRKFHLGKTVRVRPRTYGAGAVVYVS